MQDRTVNRRKARTVNTDRFDRGATMTGQERMASSTVRMQRVPLIKPDPKPERMVTVEVTRQGQTRNEPRAWTISGQVD